MSRNSSTLQREGNKIHFLSTSTSQKGSTGERQEKAPTMIPRRWSRRRRQRQRRLQLLCSTIAGQAVRASGSWAVQFTLAARRAQLLPRVTSRRKWRPVNSDRSAPERREIYTKWISLDGDYIFGIKIVMIRSGWACNACFAPFCVLGTANCGEGSE